MEESGEHIVAGARDFILKFVLRIFRMIFMGGVEIVKSDSVVSFCETVLERSICKVMSKSPNKHNRLYMEARPLEDGLAEAIDEGCIVPRDMILRSVPRSWQRCLVGTRILQRRSGRLDLKSPSLTWL